MNEPKEGDLRVWWVPQVPMTAFIMEVQTLREARLLLRALAAYDIFQFEHRVKPDFSNAGGLDVYEDGEWLDYCSPDGDEIDALTDAEIEALDQERAKNALRRPA